MLKVIIPEQHYEIYDEENNEFIYVDVPETPLSLEHSLISVAKWEQKWHRAFLGDEDKVGEEITDYVRCMTLTRNVNPIVYSYIPDEVMQEIVTYIKDPMTATTFKESTLRGGQRHSREIITAEIVYDWMISLNIPVEFEKWHLNTLLTLIRVRTIKSSPKQKVDPSQAARERAALNAERRARFNSKG